MVNFAGSKEASAANTATRVTAVELHDLATQPPGYMLKCLSTTAWGLLSRRKEEIVCRLRIFLNGSTRRRSLLIRTLPRATRAKTAILCGERDVHVQRPPGRRQPVRQCRQGAGRQDGRSRGPPPARYPRFRVRLFRCHEDRGGIHSAERAPRARDYEYLLNDSRAACSSSMRHSWTTSRTSGRTSATSNTSSSRAARPKAVRTSSVPWRPPCRAGGRRHEQGRSSLLDLQFGNHGRPQKAPSTFTTT